MIRSEVSNDWASRLQWKVSRDGKPVTTVAARAETVYEHADKTPGTYEVVAGQFIFPLQRTVERYNVAANAMTAAAKRVAELGEERTRLMQSQQEGWEQIANGK